MMGGRVARRPKTPNLFLVPQAVEDALARKYGDTYKAWSDVGWAPHSALATAWCIARGSDPGRLINLMQQLCHSGEDLAAVTIARIAPALAAVYHRLINSPSERDAWESRLIVSENVSSYLEAQMERLGNLPERHGAVRKMPAGSWWQNHR